MHTRRILLMTLALTAPVLSFASGKPTPSSELAVQRYLTRTDPPLSAFHALRHLEASTRGGKVSGWVDACTSLDHNGYRFRVVSEGGSALVRKRVLLPALEEEQRMRHSGESERAAIIPANYSFSATDAAPDGLVRIELSPLRKEQALIRGEMFVSADSGALVRVKGALVKRPSFWTRHVEIERRYEPVLNVWAPVSMTSDASVLIVGHSSFAMTYQYFSVNGTVVPGSEKLAETCVSPQPLPVRTS